MMRQTTLIVCFWVTAVLPATTTLYAFTPNARTNPPTTKTNTAPTKTKSPINYITGTGENTDPESRDLTVDIDINDIDMESLTNVRPYHLFVPEKICDVLEDPRKFGAKAKDASHKEKIVVLGTGWGATAFLKNIDTSLYDVTVISPRNFFLFTPMLAGASVGSVEYRSITEPVREINPNVDFLEGSAVYIDPKSQTVVVEPVECDGNNCGIIEHEEVKYDRLLYTVGATTNTFGIPGVHEHCNFLKSVEDARRIRAAVVNCFERANFKDLTDDERRRYLTFCVIGAGPSGVELASEIRTFIEEDGPKYYPHLLKDVRIKVIEATGTVLAPFHKDLQQEAIRRLNSESKMKDEKVRKLLPPHFTMSEVMLEARVKEIKEDTIDLLDGTSIPYGLAVWAAGNAPLPLTKELIEQLGDQQAKEQPVARGRIAIDPWMRAIGGAGKILALGDASCVVPRQLPATGQVAAQEGEYLARLLNKQYDLSVVRQDSGSGNGTGLLPPMRIANVTVSSTADRIAELSTKSHDFARPFQYLDLGILAYTGGDTALAQVATVPGKDMLFTGFIGNELWKSVYLWKQVSWKNRISVWLDWAKRRVFGRDITHLE